MANSKTKSRKKFKIKKIPKYDNAGIPQGYTTNPQTEQVIDTQTGQPFGQSQYNIQGSNMYSTPENPYYGDQTNKNQGKATGAVTAGIGTMGVIQSQAPQTSEFSKKISNQQSIEGGIATGVMSYINPALGALTGAAYSAGAKQRAKNEQIDPNTGELVNEDKARRGAMWGAFANPITAMTTRFSYKGGWKDLSGKGYTAELEKEGKANIAAQNAESIVPYETPQYFKKGGKIWKYANGGIYQVPNPIEYKAEVEKDELYVNKEGKVEVDYKHLNPHNTKTDGSSGFITDIRTLSKEGMFISAKDRELYLNSDGFGQKLKRNTTVGNQQYELTKNKPNIKQPQHLKKGGKYVIPSTLPSSPSTPPQKKQPFSWGTKDQWNQGATYLPAAYNLFMSGQKTVDKKAIYNPHENEALSILRNQKINREKGRRDIYNMERIGSDVRSGESQGSYLSRRSQLSADAMGKVADFNLNADIADAQFKDRYASGLDTFGQQRVGADIYADKLNTMAKVNKAQYLPKGISQLGEIGRENLNIPMYKSLYEKQLAMQKDQQQGEMYYKYFFKQNGGDHEKAKKAAEDAMNENVEWNPSSGSSKGTWKMG